MGPRTEIALVGLAGDVAEVLTDVLKELKPLRFTETMGVVSIGVREPTVDLGRD